MLSWNCCFHSVASAAFFEHIVRTIEWRGACKWSSLRAAKDNRIVGKYDWKDGVKRALWRELSVGKKSNSALNLRLLYWRERRNVTSNWIIVLAYMRSEYNKKKRNKAQMPFLFRGQNFTLLFAAASSSFAREETQKGKHNCFVLGH